MCCEQIKWFHINKRSDPDQMKLNKINVASIPGPSSSLRHTGATQFILIFYPEGKKSQFFGLIKQISISALQKYFEFLIFREQSSTVLLNLHHLFLGGKIMMKNGNC